MPKHTVHCIECNSQNVVMANAICKWDIDNQKWEYSENYDPMFHCSECGSQNVDYKKEENN